MAIPAFIIIVIALLSLCIPEAYSDSAIYAGVSLAFLVAVVFMFSREKNDAIRIVFLRPSVLFIISFLVVFFQRPLDYALGYDFTYIQMGSPSYMIRSIKYALTGLCMFCCGYLFEAQKINSTTHSRQAKQVNPNIFALLSSILIILVILFVPKSILMGGYNNDMLTNATLYNYLASWSNTLLITYLVQFTINAKQTDELAGVSVWQYLKKVGIWHNCNVMAYALLTLNVGDRGPLIVMALAYYISYIIVSHKSLSRIKVTLALLTGMMVVSILGDTKQYRDNNTIFDRLVERSNEQEITEKTSSIPLTEQLSGSYCCTPIALQMVPGNQDYTYGMSLLTDITSSIPFIGRFLKQPPSASYRISRYAIGDNFSFGLGTNCIASLYLDGGLIFIVLGMLLFGVLMRKMEISIFSDSTSLFMFCFSFYFLTHVVSIPRSTLLSPFKYAIWMYLVLVLFRYISSVRNYD